MIYIYHHLGLGDHFLLNGLVREYKDSIGLFCKQHNYESVSFMYSDLPNLKVIISTDYEAYNFLITNNDTQIKLGYCGNGFYNDGIHSFDELFYIQAGIDIKKKWDFYVLRDLEREKNLFNKVKLPKRYAFIHEDLSRGYVINKSLITIPYFCPDRQLTDNIFDYLSIIENAEEIHCIDSSFLCLIDSMGIIKNNYFHRYSRPETQSRFLSVKIKEEWKIIKDK